MKRFKNILLFLQPEASKALLRRAAQLAKTNQARLTIVDVIEELPRDMRMLMLAATPMELQEIVIQERLKYLEPIVATLDREGIQAGVDIMTGTPFLAIIRQVLRQKHDLMIMAADGRSGLKGQLLGSTSLHLK